jgi:LysM repeat protein
MEGIMRHTRSLYGTTVISLCLTLLTVAFWTTPAEAQQAIYTVRTGDTLFGIALQYNTSVAAIMQANGITNANLIYVGQQLAIPSGSAAPSSPPAQPGTGGVVYTVRTGDTLFGIARRYGVGLQILAQANGIVNPSLIYVGQQLTIPGVSDLPTEPTPSPTAQAPTPTPEPGEGFYYTVQSGDTLLRIAARYQTTVALIAAANSLANPNWITVGQQLWIPGGAGTPSVPSPSPATPSQSGLGYGIQVHLIGQDKDRVLGAVNDLGFSWIKQQIEWKLFEPVRGQIQWAELDAMVNAAEAHHLSVLFSVVKAPAWARPTTAEDGPPANYQDYWTFVGALAARYKGRVDAYEIWNEQNLRREWNGDTLSASRYMQLLAGAYNAVKGADPGAAVVSGALAPTGWNDGVTAIDDRVYLDAMYAAGLKSFSDMVGAHPNGWANSPTSYCCRQEGDVPSHNDHHSFFFRHTLEDYRNIMVRWGDGNTRIWATEFGWGTLEGLGGSPQPGYEFVSYNSLSDQANYLTQAFSLARSYSFVGAMFVWNLNFCPVAGAGAEQCYWGIVGPDWTPRPAYDALKNMPKP